jgi:hypothetical protein
MPLFKKTSTLRQLIAERLEEIVVKAEKILNEKKSDLLWNHAVTKEQMLERHKEEVIRLDRVLDSDITNLEESIVSAVLDNKVDALEKS